MRGTTLWLLWGLACLILLFLSLAMVRQTVQLRKLEETMQNDLHLQRSQIALLRQESEIRSRLDKLYEVFTQSMEQSQAPVARQDNLLGLVLPKPEQILTLDEFRAMARTVRSRTEVRASRELKAKNETSNTSATSSRNLLQTQEPLSQISETLLAPFLQTDLGRLAIGQHD